MSAAPAYYVAFVLAVVLSRALSAAVRRWATRTGFVDHPGGRKVQDSPVALGGGLAVLAAFALTVLAGTAAILLAPRDLSPSSPLGSITARVEVSRPVLVQLAAILVGATVALFTGLMDDRRKKEDTFPVWAKLAGQSLAAIPAIATGVHVTFLPGEALDVIGTFVWILLITNAFNFLDNMDGLSAGIAAVASALFAAVAIAEGQILIAGLLVALLGSLLGFLPQNFFPARLYLGDAGAFAIGNLLGTLTVLESYVTRDSATLLPVCFPLIVLAVPLIDTSIAVVSRFRERRPLHVADHGHLSHRLVARGLSRRQAVVVLYLLTLCFGLSATLLPGASAMQSALVLAQAVALATLLVALLAVIPRRDPPP
ncbi:MAG: undecaprenyl/decaprenyl-phosphate alpha-N-acetylglucosaminyl 1-phosphate transferase [Planctomycetes bacterium]|nr:undecaprenyl/decaprenyl-phosphate alpha-N-acetylglucosaminyl 1-phosphate transferase [Planctomycetota bacterium]